MQISLAIIHDNIYHSINKMDSGWKIIIFEIF